MISVHLCPACDQEQTALRQLHRMRPDIPISHGDVIRDSAFGWTGCGNELRRCAACGRMGHWDGVIVNNDWRPIRMEPPHM